MGKTTAAIVGYEKPLESVRKAIELSNGFRNLSANDSVFIKPNICFWQRGAIFPKWGVITTSRVVEDIVFLLKEYGIDDITIGEGLVLINIKDRETPTDAFDRLGYHVLRDRYGVKVINIYERPFEKVDLGSGVKLNFNTDFLQSDFVVNIPVLKTHVQTVVSLGIKNLKGMIDVESRKICHNADPERNLNFMIAKLATSLSASCTVIDGIYTNEIGPALEGKIKRRNILVACPDPLSADFLGAKILGYQPSEVPHLVYAAHAQQKPLDLSDIEVVGKRIEAVACYHEHALPYDDEQTLPMSLAKSGIKGLALPKYDLTVCTYCTILLPKILAGIREAWKGRPWDDIEILFGKTMQPTPGKKKTILIGKCIHQANRKNPDIKEAFSVKGCPPRPESVVKVLQQAGIEMNPRIFKMMEMSGIFLMQKYAGRPEFEESLFKIA